MNKMFDNNKNQYIFSQKNKPKVKVETIKN